MRSWWQRMNYRIRDRLLWASMPTLLLSLLAAGLCSWAIFAENLTQSSIHHNSHELINFRQAVQDRAVTEALSTLTMDDGLSPHTAGLVKAQLVGDPQGGLAPKMVYFPTSGARDQGRQQGRLLVWWQNHLGQLAAEGELPTETGSFDIFSGQQTVRIFSPFLTPQGSPTNPNPQAILPVMVRRTQAREHSVAVSFLDLGELLHTYGTSSWWSAVDVNGLVMASSDRNFQIGASLGTLASEDSPDFLTGEKGTAFLAELVQSLPAGGKDWQTDPQGRRKGGWIVVGDRCFSSLVLLTAVPAGNLDVLIGRNIIISMGIVLLSLILALLGVVRVVNAASNRLYALGGAMRAVAKGDLDCRLAVTKSDEVDTLISYFNHMADDLRENRRLAEERSSQLRSTVTELKQLDKAKQEFLTLVSHEVRTPLTAIKGGVEYLRSSTNDLPAAEQEFLENHNLPEILNIIDKSTRRLGGFMNDATVMANVQALNKRLTINSAPVREILTDILERLAEPIKTLGLDVRDELGSTAKWHLLGDVEMLTIALEKVVDNAVNHNIPAGQVLIREVQSIPGLGSPAVLQKKITQASGEVFDNNLWEDQPVKWRLIEVFNTGVPIPGERRAALFTEFELVGPIENHQRGTGLSMPIVKTALERHGGGVFVASGQGDGNSFYLLIPSSDQLIAIRGSTNLWDHSGSNV